MPLLQLFPIALKRNTMGNLPWSSKKMSVSRLLRRLRLWYGPSDECE
jgi:hypothetical protein